MTKQREARLRERVLTDRATFMVNLVWNVHARLEQYRLRVVGHYYGHCRHPDDERYPIDMWEDFP